MRTEWMPEMLTVPVNGDMAWTGSTAVANDGRYPLDQECIDEIRATAADLAANPLPIVALDPADFPMPACLGLMARVKQALGTGAGFAIMEGLPWAECDLASCKAIHWLMMSLLGRTVAQKWNGEMVYDVLDTGRTEALGAGVRGSKTSGGQGYHTDNSYNLPPDYVGLSCLKTAMEGGLSGLVSFYSVHNTLLERHPSHLRRLYEDFYFERFDEFAPGECVYAKKPIFTFKRGNLGVCLSTNRVRIGYEAAGVKMDTRTHDALAALDEVLEDESLGKTFEFQPGETQVVNNRRIGHRRTAFKDWPDPARRRHLVRIWVREQGRRCYAG